MGITRKLNEVCQAMSTTTTQTDLPDFLNNHENAQRLNGLVEEIRYALMDYQVCTANTLNPTVSNICLRLRCDETSTTRVVNRW